MGLRCICEVPLRVLYHDKTVGEYFADIVVEDTIIVETKAVSGRLDAVHEVQLVNYLKATGLTIGLLINFGRSVEVKAAGCSMPRRDRRNPESPQKIRVNPC